MYGLDFCGLSLDFRDWYQFWLEKGEDDSNPDYEGWGTIWFLDYERDRVLATEPDTKYRKLTFFEHNFPKNEHIIYRWLTYAGIFLAGLVIGKIL